MAIGAAVVGAPVALAVDTPMLQLRIFPLECSIDTLSTGVNSLVQISPEECRDEPPLSPEVPHEPASPSFIPSQPFDRVMHYSYKTGYESARPLLSQPAPIAHPADLGGEPVLDIKSIKSDAVTPTLLIAFVAVLLVSPLIVRSVHWLLRRTTQSR